ncbi:MAG: glycosyltransferase family 4 protein [Cyclobacteriaceae bacterium]|nr:glycosyltransferase family 4 protein [Cyclobacteriaceae bacterium]
MCKRKNLVKKILMFLNAPYPADIRVKKESDALLKAGFEIHLLCLRKKNQAYTEQFEGIHLHRIDAGKNNYQLAFWDVIMSIQFAHPSFMRAARIILKKHNIDALHIHDLPLAGTALALKKKIRIPVLVDFHENYPEALRTWFKWKKNPVVRIKNYFFMNPTRWTQFEKLACDQCDRIIAVVDEMKTRLINEHRVSENKITVVTNTEDKQFIQQPLDTSVYDSLAGKFILTYSGGIGPHRGVDTAITGMQYLKDFPDIQLAIVGFGSPSVMNNLKTLVASLQLNNVHFFGYQPFSKFYSYMHLASVNVIPHQSNGHTDNTVPHKLFQGMMAAKPLLVSSCAPLKRLAEKYGSGIVFEAGDPQQFAEKVLMLYNTPALCKQLGDRGKQVTLEENVNWEYDQRALVSLYQNL